LISRASHRATQPFEAHELGEPVWLRSPIIMVAGRNPSFMSQETLLDSVDTYVVRCE